MTYKRARVIVFAMLIAIGIMLVLGKCMPVASADIIGPPTIETHLANINDNMQTTQWMIGIIGTLLTLLMGALGYAYKRDMKSVNEKADKALEKTDDIEKEFLSIDSFKLWLQGKGSV